LNIEYCTLNMEHGTFYMEHFLPLNINYYAPKRKYYL
jgi:hypothetical protein